jgi:tetratricopeptide (TPR) repeat protein
MFLTRRAVRFALAVSQRRLINHVSQTLTRVSNNTNSFDPQECDRTITKFNKILNQEPKNVPVLWEKAVYLMALSRFDEATQTFDNLIEAGEEATSGKLCALEERGFELMTKSREFEKAIHYFDRVLEIEPRRSSSHHFRFLSSMNLGDITTAIKNLENELKIREEFSVYLVIDLANAYMEMKKPDDAINVINNTMSNVTSEMLNNRVLTRELIKIKIYAFIELNRFEEALETSIQAKQYGKDSELMSLRATALRALDRNDEADKVEAAIEKAQQKKALKTK